MNRFQKKCFIGSTGAHLLLVVVLFVGPAFLTSKSKVDDMPPLDFVPWKTVDAMVSGGGNPQARPPAAVPTPPVPAPPVVTPPSPPVRAERVKEPEPPKDPPKDVAKTPAADSFETSKTPKRKLPNVSTKVVNAKTDTRKTSRQNESQQQDQADTQRRALANAISSAAHSVRDEVSAATTVDTNYGPGGGGEAYANYAQVVKTIYEREWVLPDTAAEDAITKVKVTIASDGRVVSAEIVKGSGERGVDKSVQFTLDRVRFIRPFPEGSKDKERTYTINFSLKAKRALG